MFPVLNAVWPCGHHHPEAAALAGSGRSLAGTRPPPPGVCCQMTEDGLSVICSDGQGFNATCPVCPYPNTPGYAKYQQVGSQLIPIPPSAGMCAGTGSDAQVDPASSGLGVVPVVGLGLLAAGAAYLLLR